MREDLYLSKVASELDQEGIPRVSHDDAWK